MEILEIITALEELTIQSRRLPVGGNLVIDRKRILDLIDQLRLAIPADIRQATQLLEARDEIVADAHEQSRVVIEDAHKERDNQLDQATIVKETQERSQKMLVETEQRAQQTITEAELTANAHLEQAAHAADQQLQDADRYALEVLTRLDAQLKAFLESIRVSIESLHERR
jgi:cell division septum initiation protein DivIVA